MIHLRYDVCIHEDGLVSLYRERHLHLFADMDEENQLATGEAAYIAGFIRGRVALDVLQDDHLLRNTPGKVG